MISPLAFVDSAAKIGQNVTIQPFAYIEGDVEIGDNSVIMSGAKILKGTKYTTMPFWELLHKISIIQEKTAG